MADSDITARGLLMLRPIPTFFTVVLVTLDTLDTDTLDTMAMDSDTSTARGLLMLSLRLRLILTTLDTIPWTWIRRTPRICRTRTPWIRIRLRQIDFIEIFQ